MSAAEIDALWEADCLKWRGKVLTGKQSHWCNEWDGLPVDETTPEWPCGCEVEQPSTRGAYRGAVDALNKATDKDIADKPLTGD